MQIERNELRVLSAIVEEEGFGRAAERLNISQSAVSQTMANLEHRLGTGLLTRGRKPRLTEAGQRLFRYAQTVLNEERVALDQRYVEQRTLLGDLGILLKTVRVVVLREGAR